MHITEKQVDEAGEIFVMFIFFFLVFVLPVIIVFSSDTCEKL